MQTDFSKKDSELINNSYYHDLSERWYTADNDPIALLRAEARLRNPWISQKIKSEFGALESVKVLDVGCGAGFLSNHLSQEGFAVTGVDLSESSLAVAKLKDQTKRVNYVLADAYQLPFSAESFDVITSTDFLEHVSEPQRVLQEVSRCLKPGGLFFFHTFNKNKLSELLVIKSLEWFVKNTPPQLHVIELFIKPKDLQKWMLFENLRTEEIHGVRPVFLQKPVWRLLFSGVVDPQFKFCWTKSLAVSYTGFARKLAQLR
jgi:2-polyprenyl-6-hydroxyphenyl methylase/3-demethylubiquinone-9 3-methyltransferase